MLNNHNDHTRGGISGHKSWLLWLLVCISWWLAGYNLHRPDGQRAPYRLHLGDLYAWVAWIQSQVGTPSHWLIEEGHPHWVFWNPLVSHGPKDYVFNMGHQARYQSISCLQLRGAVINEGDELWVQEIARWEENHSLIYSSWDTAS